MRRAGVGKKIKRLVAAEDGCLTLIAELRDLFPLAVRAEQVKSEIAAVTIGHGRDHIFAVVRSFENDLGDARKIFADRVCVFAVGRSEFMKINLLIKIQVSVWPLAFARKARVINAGAIRIPGRASAGGRILHMRDRIGQRFAGRGFVKMQCAVFASALRN